MLRRMRKLDKKLKNSCVCRVLKKGEERRDKERRGKESRVVEMKGEERRVDEMKGEEMIREERRKRRGRYGSPMLL